MDSDQFKKCEDLGIECHFAVYLFTVSNTIIVAMGNFEIRK
jgi:hypothetical protein